MSTSHFTQSVRGKIITAFLLACFALGLAWTVSKMAFRQMLGAVETMSTPNDKLRMVEELSLHITRLNDLQKSNGQTDGEPARINRLLDTLNSLYTGDSTQRGRIASLKQLLQDRERVASDYLRVKQTLVDTQPFLTQVRSMDELVARKQTRTDSLVVTAQHRTVTTTVYPRDSNPPKPASGGLLHKLFGHRKKSPSSSAPYQVVREELHTKVDTISTSARDTAGQSLGATMHHMALSQRRNSLLFVSREADLAASDNRLIRQMLVILKQVESEAVAQMGWNNAHAESVVNTGITRINAIMLAFLLIMALLLYFILTDIAHSNQYRIALESARDEAEYHASAKQRFLANMSHEIRTPLQSIIGYAERIQQKTHADEKDIDAIYHSSGHLMQIVNEVLDYNRIISGKFTFTRQVFSLDRLLDEVASVMRLQAERKSLSLDTRYDVEAPCMVVGDPFRLRQVLYNLLGNAIKFTYAGAVMLSVTREEKDGEWLFTFAVSDTGPGISPVDMQRIFNEFEQGSGQPEAARYGAGLGLTISKALIEEQGGHITVQSVPGEGSRFVFSLFYGQAQALPAALQEVRNRPALGSGATVWVVDDDRLILDICSGILTRNGIPHRCFASSEELLCTPWDESVRFVLLDIRMPGMSGLELCEELRRRIPSGLRIFALTAQVLPEEQDAVLSRDIDGLLLKPFREKELLGLLGVESPAAEAPMPSADMVEWDVSSLEKMTFGDPVQLARVLSRFVQDSRHDMLLLRQYLDKGEVDNVRLLIHRIAGRTGQLGARQVAIEFRRLEKDLARLGKLDDVIRGTVLVLCEKLTQLVAKASPFGVG